MTKEFVTCDACGKTINVTDLTPEWITFAGTLTIAEFEKEGTFDFCTTSCFIKYIMDKKIEEPMVTVP